eukprot:COSAG01_NODE_1015_length_12114_cov_214.545651_12_plen_58_part_00
MIPPIMKRILLIAALELYQCGVMYGRVTNIMQPLIVWGPASYLSIYDAPCRPHTLSR